MKVDISWVWSLLAPIAVFLFIGTFFDALSNILEWITLKASIVGTVLVLLIYSLIAIIKNKGLLFVGDARVKNIRNVNAGLVGVLLALWIPQIIGCFNTGNSIEKTIDQGDSVSLFQETDRLRILLLPFHPDLDCKIRDTDFERQIVERYKEKSENENLKVEIALLHEDSCPITENDAKRIAREYLADIVIWGQYEDNCYENSSLRIRHTLTYDLYSAEQKPIIETEEEIEYIPLVGGDTQKQAVPNLDTLRRGYLLEDIDFLTYYLLGLVAFNESAFSEAVELFSRALLLKPCDTNSIATIGQALIRSVEDSLSLDMAMWGLYHYGELCEESPALSYYKGYLYQEIGYVDSAAHYFQSTITLDSERYYHLQAQVFLGDIYIQRSEFVKAEEVLQNVIQNEPRWSPAYECLGKIYRIRGEFERSRDYYLELGEKGQKAKSLYELTSLCLEFRKTEEAERYLEDWYQLVKDRPDLSETYLANVHYYFAWVAVFREDYKKAVEHLERAIQIDQDDDRYLDLYEKVLYAQQLNVDATFEYNRVY